MCEMSMYREEVIKPGDAASKLAKHVNRGSYLNSEAIRVIDRDSNGFRNPVGFIWREEILREMLEQYQTHDWQIIETAEGDGNGQKPGFYTLIGTPEVMYGQGFDLVAMNVDDFARSGRFGVAMISNEINVKRATKDNFHLIEALFDGFADALKQSHLVSITGEFAVMKHSITTFCDLNSDDQLVLVWGGTVHGLMRHSKLINNTNIRAGMPAVGFWEPGYRCNGGGRNIQILTDLHGGDIQAMMKDARTMDFVRELATPCKVYASAMSRAHGWLPDGLVRKPVAEMVGAAHITGGGLFGKAGEILPPGVGLLLDNMPVPCNALRQAQLLSQETKSPIDDWECHDSFHGGVGMVVICPDEHNAERLIECVGEGGIKAQIIGGTVKSENNRVTVHSRFAGRRIVNSDDRG
jgi:phosphoribosylaminoimidazole (AIR) synthetase